MTSGEDNPITLQNLTSRRISISSNRGGPLVIPPFGERVIEANTLQRYDYKPWEDQHLVTRQVSPHSLQQGRLSWGEWLSRAKDSAWNVVSFLFVVAMGYGIPLYGVIVVWGNPLNLTAERRLAIFVLWVFVGVAATVPASLYFLFHRLKLRTLRDNFIRDVVRLDPNVQTLKDAEETYGSLVDEVYGSGEGGAFRGGSRIPIFGATLLISVFWLFVVLPENNGSPPTFREIFVPHEHVIAFAFLGSYVFAVNLLFRRYARADLGPKAYTHICVRILAAVAAVWVVSRLPFPGIGPSSGWMFGLAFLIGIVPETGPALVQDVLQRRKGGADAVFGLKEKHPLSSINGISLYDRARLLEVGIENVESLAHHNLIDLMLWTRIPTARLVDFIDQAILHLHVVGPGKTQGEFSGPDGALRLLASIGIRTATDLERAYSLASGRGQEEEFLSILDGDLRVSRLRVVLDAMEDDEWMVSARNWRDQGAVGKAVSSVEEFLEAASRGVGPVSPSVPPSAVEEERHDRGRTVDLLRNWGRDRTTGTRGGSERKKWRLGKRDERHAMPVWREGTGIPE